MPRHAAEHRLDDDTPVVFEIGYHLVTGHERERDNGIEVARRAPVDSREVAATDARETRADVHPSGSRQLGRIGVDESEWTDACAPAGQHLARKSRRGVARELALEEQRLHERASRRGRGRRSFATVA